MKTKKIISLILSAIFILPLSLFAGAIPLGNDIFVSPSGEDTNSGSFNSPVATIEKAKELAKGKSGDVTVYFREGTYTFKNTVTFDSSDKANVTYKAYNNENVVFTAGTPIKGFKECTVNGVNAFYANVSKSADFNILFNETTTLSRTRYPESGYFYVDSVKEEDIIHSATDEEFHNSSCSMYADTSDLLKFKNETDIIVRILHYWKDEILRVTSCDTDTGYVTFNAYSSMNVKEGDKYFFENVFEALDKPGEWYLDKTECKLYYVPQEGETAEDLTLWASETETMFSINGVDGISFEGITFRANGFSSPKDGVRDFSQAAYNATHCIEYNNAKDFSIKNCNFKDIASCAVFLGYNVQNATVNSCYFNNIGAQAVYVRGENLAIENPNVTKNITVTNNIVYKYGQYYYNAVGVLVIHANSVNIENNEIHDGYYTAISVGWVWGYGYSVTYNNRICNNLVYNIGQGWLSDMGGVYTLGNQPGTVISGNVFHNIAADVEEGGYGGWGIYLDEGSSYILVENNLVYACGSDSYHLHYGSYNTVRNNIFALSGESQIRVVSSTSRCTPADGGKTTASFTNNIILTDNKVRAFSYLQDKDYSDINNNIIWDLTNGDEIYISINSDANKSISLKRAVTKGYITNPVVINPLFKDAKNFDFDFSDSTTVTKYGFEIWDYSEAGTKEGTTIGTSLQGGTTPYNAESSSQKTTSSKEIFHKLFEFFYKLIEFFKGLF